MHMKSKGEKGALIGAAMSRIVDGGVHRHVTASLPARRGAGEITKAMCFYAPESTVTFSWES